MNVIGIDNYTYNVPGNWDELSSPQLIKICDILLQYHSLGETTAEEWRYLREECLKTLLNWRKPFLFMSKEQKAFVNLPPEHRVALLNDPDLLPWIFEKATLASYVIQNFNVKGKTFIGPHENLIAVTVEDMIACHISAQLYEVTKDSKHLIELIANLYRPQDPNYKSRSTYEAVPDKREKNSLFAQEEREEFFARELKPGLCMAIYLQYCSHLESFTSRYPLFFEQVKEKNESSDLLQNLESYFLLVKNLSGSKFGNYSQTRRESADVFFAEVEDNIQANIDRKKTK